MIETAILFAAIILAVSIFASALTRLIYHVRPKKSFAQISIGGVTDTEGEAFQATVTLFPDEDVSVWKEKLLACYDLKEWRLKMQNDRMQAIHAEAKRLAEEAKANR